MNLSLHQVFAQVKEDGHKIGHVVDGPIHYMVLNNNFNMIDFEFIDRVNHILDLVEASKDEAVLVTISTHPKVFCSGFDIVFWEKAVENKPLSVSML